MLSRYFKKEKSNVNSQMTKARKLRMETLENRELLSVTPLEYAESRELYSAFEQSENISEANVVDLTAAMMSAQAQAALDAAQATPQNDLIAGRTTSETWSARFGQTTTINSSIASSASESTEIVVGDVSDGATATYWRRDDSNASSATTAISGAIDLGPYELQGSAPNAPSDLVFWTYDAAKGTLQMSW
ncbi:MAG: hypothetical protein IKK39_06375, partial [Thermoguttaceae bacterium]|nr:hypothetical protein [Thermoguttaceae bacterium]